MKCPICGDSSDKLVRMTYRGKPMNDDACNACSTLFEALSWLTENEVARIDENYWVFNPDSKVPDELIIEAAERKKKANANKRASAIKAHQRIKQQKSLK